MALENNHVISIEYEVREHGKDEILDSNLNARPLEFILGSGQVISGLENALFNANVGDKLSLTIAPQDAYGERHQDYVQEVERAQFEGIELERGMTLFGQGENGETVQVIVQDFNDEMVIIDYNHPLAGKTLQFEVKILSAREASENEIFGGCCGGGGHGGSCCGGGHCG